MAAGDEERAIQYSIRAGDHAAQLCAPAEAARLYEAALEYLTVAGDEARTAAVRRARGAALDQLNRLVEARAEFETALQAFSRLGDAVGQALVHRDIALMHMVRSEMTDAAGHLDRALALWPADREDADLVQLLLHGAFCKAAAGDAARAASLRARGLSLAEQVGDPVLLDWAAFLDDSTAHPNGWDGHA
jgi:tetratricopeptide (TPR) repeat protein